MQDRLFDMLMQKDELTWQNIIYDLVKSEEMNPWDIDVSLLANRYLETIRKLQEHNFFISGKIILASSILLRIKSNKLVDEDINAFDNYLFNTQELEEEAEFIENKKLDIDIPKLAIKTPQARKRRVNLNDLMNALQKALDVDKRRTIRRVEEQNFVRPELPEKKIDISQLIKEVYSRILSLFKKKEKITFSRLVNSDKKEDKILTLIPLLHLDNSDKIELNQEEHFGEIDISIRE